MAAEGVIITFIFTGVDGEDIPQNATHLIIHESVTVIPEGRFGQHPNIVEVYCHIGVTRIESGVFLGCLRLRRVIIPGVKVIEFSAFIDCTALTYVDCDNLEIIEAFAFSGCRSLRSIYLPSIKVVEENAFNECDVITDVKFGKELESIGELAFWNCPNLERITIPLKTDLFAEVNVFYMCGDLNHVDLVERAVLLETIAALQLEEWRNDMNEELDSVNRILPNAAGGDDYDEGSKAEEIGAWIARVLQKIIHYKAAHWRSLNEAATTLGYALPNDTVMNNVLPFLQLPLHRFDGEEERELR